MGDGSTLQRPAGIGGGGAIGLLERESEFVELDSLVAAAARGDGAAMLIEGPPGIGKTALRRTAETLGEQIGLSVLSAQGGELERRLPWAVIRDLLGPPMRKADEGERKALLSGAAALASPVLAETAAEHQTVSDQLAEVLHGLFWLTSNLSQRSALLLAVDDAHWADPASFDFLVYLAQRVSDLPVLLLVAGRPAEPGGGTRRLGALSDRTRVIRPSPLSQEGVEELIRRDFKRQPDAEFVAACHRATGGNPFLLSELQIELHHEEVSPVSENAARVSEVTPEAISHAVLLRLNRLPEPAVRLAQSVAVLGTRARLADTARLAGLDPDTAAATVEELAEAEVLGRDLPLTFAHPIVRRVVYEQMIAPARARLHGKAAELLAEKGGSAEEIAVHLIEVEPAGDPDVVERLREAARRSVAEGATDAAVQYLRRALAEPPSRRERARVLVELARTEAALADPEALPRLDEAVALLEDSVERAEVLHELGWMLFSTGRHADAARAFSRGVEEIGSDESDLALELRTGRFVLSTLGRTGHDAVRELSEAGLLDTDDQAPSPGQRTALTQLAVARVFAARAADEARELALRALGDGAMVTEGGVSLLWSVAVSCLIWCDSLDEADREIAIGVRLLRERPSVADRAYVLFGRSWVRLWRGELVRAAADAQAAVDAWSGGWGAHVLGARWYLSRALIERGDLDEAERAVELAPGDQRYLEEPVHQAWFHAGRGQVALAKREAEGARREFGHVEALAADLPLLRNPAAFLWRVDAARAALLLGDREEARRLASEDVQLARQFGARRSLGFTLCASGLAEGGAEGVERLREAVEVLERSPSKLELCRARVELGAALRRQGAVTEARDRLREGLGLAQRLGLRSLEERANAELLAA
ncbi:MAG: ATP-binding protein, partial [Solirubrobacterales bacterium]